MLSIDDIDINVDYDTLCFLESHLMHEIKRMGKDAFVKEYSKELESFRKEWSKRDFCYLLALLGYLDSSFSYDETVKLDKYILDARDFIFIDDSDFNNLLNERLSCVLDSFYSRGFIYSEIEEAV